MATSSLDASGILVIEDDSLLRKRIAAHLETMGADVTPVGTVQAARQALADFKFEFALLDLNLPDGRGTDLLKEQAFSPTTAVVVMTAEGGVSAAVECMRLGAKDYLVKPFDIAELPLVLQRAQKSRQEARLKEHRRQADSADDLYFGTALSEMRGQLEKILEADHRIEGIPSPILIEGETGTGKTAVARWLHARGPRGDQPLVELNCAAIPEALAESELFGHERGAFTDARSARIGLFEAASGGTLLLDELPSLSTLLQAKVLKVLEDHRIRRLGGAREMPVDVRVIAAAHTDLSQLVEAGQFRADLFHRLDLFRVRIKPLRERGEDIVTLATVLLEKLCHRHRVAGKTIGKEGIARLRAYPWPGNVRELGHELERSIVFESGSELNFARLSGTGMAAAPVTPDDWFNSHFRFPEQGFDLDDAIGRLVQHALEQTGNNVSAAARVLGVTRDFLRYRLSGPKGPGPAPATKEES